METYYTKKIAIPPEGSEESKDVRKAIALCWVLANKPDDGERKAIFHIERAGWIIEETIVPATRVVRDDFVDTGITNFDKAQVEGAAVVFVGAARDGKTEKGPIELKSESGVSIAVFLKESKKNRTRGRCLHYDAGERCTKYCNAHSIQKKGMLSRIAMEGHVYGVSHDHSVIMKNKGRITHRKIGIAGMSTFLGFCSKHDNELFEPIDDHFLIPTDNQAFLYAYRSLCRELFVKENSHRVYEYILKNSMPQKAIKDMLQSLYVGNAFGLANLEMHKAIFDDSLSKKQYEAIRYLCFRSSGAPTVAFSGVIYPDFDFNGNLLQDLAKLEDHLELLTFCSAPIENGWGFLFAWHESSSYVCTRFINSLQEAVGTHSLGDMLFRMALSCENHAISPLWWESLPETSVKDISERMTEIADLHVRTANDYLSKGLESISGWEFSEVSSKY